MLLPSRGLGHPVLVGEEHFYYFNKKTAQILWSDEWDQECDCRVVAGYESVENSESKKVLIDVQLYDLCYCIN